MVIHLTDDGTMDTVLCCDECGEEFCIHGSGRRMARGYVSLTRIGWI